MVRHCPDCFTIKAGHTCNAMLGTDVELKCGCTAPVLAEACDLVSQIKAKMPVSDGCLDGRKIRVLIDTGCSTVVMRRGLVSEDKFTGNIVVCVMIDGTARRNPTALVNIDTRYLSGTVEAVCMERPLYDVIIGNVPGVQHDVSEKTTVEVDKIVQAQTVVTRAQAQREGKVKPLKAVSSIDCDVSTEELIELQKKDESLSKW